jgi:hypothetical protein
MATARPFAYNTGAGITGTDQVGSLAVGTPTEGFSATGLEWWNGPDEDLGYVIAQSVPGDTQPTPVPGVSASVGFFRSSALTDPSFISLANVIAGPSGPFASGSTAKSWLNANGYWTSYVEAATGAFTVLIFESGSDVIMESTGTLNINGLTLIGADEGPISGNSITVNNATFISGVSAKYDKYSGFTTTPSNFGTGGSFGASSSTGGIFAMDPFSLPTRALLLPTGYTTGTPLSSTQTFTGETFSSMGLVPGTYPYTWGSGANSYAINVVVGSVGIFNITISEVGPDVVWSGSGSFNLTSLTLVNSLSITSGFNASSAIWIAGATATPPGPTGQYYGGASLTYPTTFASGSQSGSPSATTGSAFGVLTGGASGRTIVVPDGYVSGTNISGSTTYAGKTIAGMGLSGGTYTWAWGSGANASSLVMVIGGTGSTGATGATGAGWLFYAATGPIGGTPPPVSDGQTIFTDNTDLGVEVTYNPNKSAGVNFLNFNLQDTDGVDYTSQFTTLQNSGGTVSVSQGSNTATYVLGVGMASINGGLGFVAIDAAAATQTVNASIPFVSGTPITIAFS